MNRKTQKNKHVRVDYKLYHYYNTEQAAWQDHDRLCLKAEATLEQANSALFGSLTEYDTSARSVEAVTRKDELIGGDYQSAIITTERPRRGDTPHYYAIDQHGNISQSTGDREYAPDPDGMPWIPEPDDPAPVYIRPDPDMAAQYTPLKEINPDTGRLRNVSSRSYIHTETGQIISYREYKRLLGYTPEAPKKTRGLMYRVVISYGHTTY